MIVGLNEMIQISTDKQALDLPFIHNFLSSTYWAKGRSREAVQVCIDNSLNFGVFLNAKQIGYARVVTDYVVFAYIMDVFIEETHRNNGYASLLMQHIMTNALIKDVQTWKLATTNAHFLYKKFGFKSIETPENMMVKNNLRA